VWKSPSLVVLPLVYACFPCPEIWNLVRIARRFAVSLYSELGDLLVHRASNWTILNIVLVRLFVLRLLASFSLCLTPSCLVFSLFSFSFDMRSVLRFRSFRSFLSSRFSLLPGLGRASSLRIYVYRPLSSLLFSSPCPGPCLPKLQIALTG